MANNDKDSLLDLSSPQDPFQPQEVFGNKYYQLSDPAMQEVHSKNAIGPDAASNMQFEEITFETGSQPAFYDNQQRKNDVIGGSLNQFEDQNQNNPFADDTPTIVPQQRTGNPSCWSIDYYTFLFDVDTKDVANRIFKSLIPFPPKFFEEIGPNPDLYGPFWIATTLVFVMAATGNLGTYLLELRDSKESSWTYDLGKLSFAAALVYCYLSLAPLALWGVLKYLNLNFKLMEIICVYGYAYFIYVPVAILCIIPVTGLHWALIGLATLMSTTFIISNFFRALRDHLAKGTIIMIAMIVLQIAFGLACLLRFYAPA